MGKGLDFPESSGHRGDDRGSAAEFEAPDPDLVVVDGLARWVNRRGRPLPGPCPSDFHECARWWREHMQEQEWAGETMMRSTVGGKPGWSQGYAIRLRTTLLSFLDLSAADKSIVVSALHDGVYWRGEPIDRFMDVYNETMKMGAHSGGVEGYRSDCLSRMRALSMEMPGTRGRAA